MPYLLVSSGAFLLLIAALGVTPFGSSKRTAHQPQRQVDRKARPVLAAIIADMRACRLPVSPALLGLVSIGCAFGLAVFLWPLRNGTVLVLSLLTGISLPYLWVRAQAAKRRRKVHQAMGQVLAQLGTVARTHKLPFQALAAAVPSFPPLLRPKFESALTAHQAGMPLPDTLRALAVELEGNFYAYQLAELAAVSIREGASFAEAVHQLTQRFRLMEELRAEERTSLHGYYVFTRIFAVASLLPLIWWVMTHSPNLSFFVERSFARGLAGWSFATALLFTAWPLLQGAEDE